MLFNKKKYHHLSDEDLCTELLPERQDLFIDLLYRRYYELVLGTCMKYLKNEVQAQDLCMEIFMKLPTKAMKSSIDKFRPWLYTVVKNECFMVLRKKKIYTEQINEQITAVQDSEYDFTLDHAIIDVRKAINHLKADQKSAIQQFYLDGKSYKEIAEINKWSDKEVKSHIQNGKRNLKVYLNKDGNSAK